jgi:hypothetical protein
MRRLISLKVLLRDLAIAVGLHQEKQLLDLALSECQIGLRIWCGCLFGRA